ncbi:hypothetical protein VPBG_00235 [Vibrio phage helene 12B3]|uniref:hypothetical protein n=1 Tax=Vibrio phage helene 12B3 TaxID=573173 RepID=UPI0002C07270|nr:hypothetical protein VPBG_00235 [Vibrio phage helene 12B3]AGG58007.1 hypothetical protein VPBG_00235 [Vibrio phage helene 12B3]
MIDKLKRNWYLLCAKWKYRKQGYNGVCCCGDDFSYHPVYFDMPRGFAIRIVDTTKEGHWRCKTYLCPSRCAKEYAITCYVESKLKG